MRGHPPARTVVGGRSLYVRLAFLKVPGENCPGYAVVDWFGTHEYVPLVVRVRDNGSAIKRAHGIVIKITDIDPSQVMISRDERNRSFYYMMRDSGYDTMI